jgi:hypothetical protein
VCYAIIDVLHFAFTTTTYAYFLFVCLFKSLLFVIHSHYSPLPHFYATTIMESSTLNIFVSMEVKPNGLCIGVGHLVGCSNNNIVNRLEHETPSKPPSNIGTNDFIV